MSPRERRPGLPSVPPRLQRPVDSGATALDAVRIERALARRARYRYVQPRVSAHPEGRGWYVHSPNCSRSVDPEGGEIAIAWLEPCEGTRALWRGHRPDATRAGWVVQTPPWPLEQVLLEICVDPLGAWWP